MSFGKVCPSWKSGSRLLSTLLAPLQNRCHHSCLSERSLFFLKTCAPPWREPREVLLQRGRVSFLIHSHDYPGGFVNHKLDFLDASGAMGSEAQGSIARIAGKHEQNVRAPKGPPRDRAAHKTLSFLGNSEGQDSLKGDILKGDIWKWVSLWSSHLKMWFRSAIRPGHVNSHCSFYGNSTETEKAPSRQGRRRLDYTARWIMREAIQWIGGLVRTSTGKTIQWRGSGHSLNRRTPKIEKLLSSSPSRKSAPNFFRLRENLKG